MGKSADAADIRCFVHSSEGRARLDEFVSMLQGRTVVAVTFSNEHTCVAIVLHLDNGATFMVFEPSLELASIQVEFADVLERERKQNRHES